MQFAEAYIEAVTLARAPTLELVSRMGLKAIAKPWLVMLYQVIRGTQPVLQHALDELNCRVPDSDRQDRERLYSFFERKLLEERGHDGALWDDLTAIGVESEGPANPYVAEMVGRQYYLIDFVHPAAYLGYIGLLEAFPPTLEQIGELERASGLPADAFRTARLHAKADIGHRKELLEVFETIHPRWHAAILSNGIRCAQLQRLALQTLTGDA